MKDILSVIMPVYNGERFIAETINSVLKQTCSEWEMFIIDDGSTDNTQSIVSSFADKRINYIYQNNQGASRARNIGIENAKGMYLSFLDADDVWSPQFIEKCLQFLRNNSQVAGVYTGIYFIDDNSNVLPRISQRKIPSKQLYARLLQGGVFPPCAVVIKANVVRQVGMFDADLLGQGTEDWDLWLRITKYHRMEALPVPIPLAYYRVYPGSISTQAAKMHAHRISVVQKHFSQLRIDPLSWSSEKHSDEKHLVYGYAYRKAALEHIAQGKIDIGWQYLLKAIRIYPRLLYQADTFYELACINQPKGYHGLASMLDIRESGSEILRRVAILLEESSIETTKELRGAAYGNIYLALGMLSDQAGDWSQARRYLWQAVRHHPKLLSPSLTRRFAKLLLGKRLVNQIKRRSGTKTFQSKREAAITDSDFS